MMPDTRTQQQRLDRAMAAPLPTCCAYHGFRDGCREGKDCPERRPLPIMFDKPERAEPTEADERQEQRTAWGALSEFISGLFRMR